MYDGYLAIGGEFITQPLTELVNSSRVDVYVENWNKKVRQSKWTAAAGTDDGIRHSEIGWLDPCNVCPDVGPLFTNGFGYFLPEVDPAPWYDPAVEGSDRFFGVMGIGVEGDEGVTRTAKVRQSLGTGGFVSRNNFLAREMTVRALAVAADDCGMAAGLDWMRTAFTTELNECEGDFLWFLNCCPDCNNTGAGGSQNLCWPVTYAEHGTGPTGCPPETWWPSNYGEFVTGPPLPSEPIEANEWCAWIENYYELSVGLPAYACDLRECIVPNLRHFRNVRVIEGPSVVSRNDMSGGTQMAEIEFVVVAADPRHYVPIETYTETHFSPDEAIEDAPDDEAQANPFALKSSRPRASATVPLPVVSTEWDRQMIEFWPPNHTNLGGVRLDVYLTGVDADSKDIRIGVWDHAGVDRFGGWHVPALPAGASIHIDGAAMEASTEWGDQVRRNTGNVLDWSGRSSLSYPALQSGIRYLVSVDVPRGSEADFTVTLSAVETEN